MSDKEQRIRMRAYEIWEREDRPDGRAQDHWRKAELEVERALKSLELPAAEEPEQAAKTASKRARPSAKAAQTDVDASGSEETQKKPTSRSKAASARSKPSGAAKRTAATRSRQTPPA